MRMRRFALLIGVVACSAVLAASDTEKDKTKPIRHTHIRLAGISIEAGYTHFSGPFYPYGFLPLGYGWWPAAYLWDPWWYGPFVHPGYFDGFARGPGMGEIELRTAARRAEVYIDGAYAGVASDLKHMWLSPGAYNIALKQDGLSFEKRVYILSGKSVRITPDLKPEAEVKP